MQIFVCDTHGASWEMIEKAASLLPPARLAKAQGCRSKQAYLDSVVGFWLVHYALTRIDPNAAPKDWRIGEAGKPYFANSNLHFSLSHTEGCIAVALDTAPVGIDVQKIAPHKEGFAKRWLNEQEAHAVAASDDPDTTLCAVWCAKEAVCKQSGTGLCSAPQKIDTASAAATQFTLSGERYALAAAPSPALPELQIIPLLQFLP